MLASRLVLGGLLGCLLACSPAEASDWSRFRGPDGNGTGGKADFPSTWGADKNLSWSLEIPGGGWSSPIVAGDKIFLTTAVAEGGGKPKGMQDGVRGMGGGYSKPTEPVRSEVWCLDLNDGKALWKSVVAEAVPEFSIHPSNTYATESPACDGERLFVYFGSFGVVACLDLDGEVQWQKDVGVYPMNANFGTGSSPILSDRLLFVQSDNNTSSFLVAFDKKSGEEIWRQKRGRGSSWSTPTLWKNSQGEQLVATGPGTAIAYDPATGKIVWELTNIEGSFTASPIYDDERVYFGNSGPGRRGPMIAVKAKAKGTMDMKSDPDAVAWVNERSGPGMASPVLADGNLYIMGSGGIFDCYDAESGERVYRKRLTGVGTVVSSLWAGDGKLFVLDETGKTFVLRTGNEFEVLAENEIEDLFWATPSVSNGRLLLRGAERLYCVRTSKRGI